MIDVYLINNRTNSKRLLVRAPESELDRIKARAAAIVREGHGIEIFLNHSRQALFETTGGYLLIKDAADDDIVDVGDEYIFAPNGFYRPVSAARIA